MSAVAEKKVESPELYAVFFMSESIKARDLEDQTIYLVGDKEAAESFIANRLLEAGIIQTSESGDLIVGDENFGWDISAAVEAAQDTFAVVEFFHEYKFVDVRTS